MLSPCTACNTVCWQQVRIKEPGENQLETFGPHMFFGALPTNNMAVLAAAAALRNGQATQQVGMVIAGCHVVLH